MAGPGWSWRRSSDRGATRVRERVLAEIDDGGFFQCIEGEARTHAWYTPRKSCPRTVWSGAEPPHICAGDMDLERGYLSRRTANDRLERWLEIGAILTTLLLPLIVFLLLLFAPRIST